mmetsp:Transcript_37161/g.77831  ORF Transcript_37161/g.77831 Transcript_37161/m.77831 type:complete len:87 (-) Transcript_37161:1880-2140(-)
MMTVTRTCSAKEKHTPQRKYFWLCSKIIRYNSIIDESPQPSQHDYYQEIKRILLHSPTSTHYSKKLTIDPNLSPAHRNHNLRRSTS